VLKLNGGIILVLRNILVVIFTCRWEISTGKLWLVCQYSRHEIAYYSSSFHLMMIFNIRWVKIYKTHQLGGSQAPWDNNTWAQSLRSNFSPRVIAPKRGVRRHLLTAI